MRCILIAAAVLAVAGVADAGGFTLLGTNDRGFAEFRRERVAAQQAELDRLHASVPIEQLHLPARPTADITHDDVDALAAGLAP